MQGCLEKLQRSYGKFGFPKQTGRIGKQRLDTIFVQLSTLFLLQNVKKDVENRIDEIQVDHSRWVKFSVKIAALSTAFVLSSLFIVKTSPRKLF